jgi:sugar lactone lactonase YvrE
MLGEAPLWDPEERRIWWVDCSQKKIFRRDPAADAEAEAFDLPGYPGSFALRTRGGLIMAYRNGLVIRDVETGDEEPFEATGADFSQERFNDGICDRAGRFWVGTMHRKRSEPVGSLFRVDPDLSVRRMASGFVVSNGMAFSPDDRIMYHHDSRSGMIYAWDFDLDEGEISNRRVFVDFAGRPGRPDGCTVDSEGTLWVAEIGGGRVVRFDSTGRQIASVQLPVSRPSSVMFGGDDLCTLFVTSMRDGLTERESAEQPLAGCLFYMRVDVPGLPEARFAG